MKLKTNWKKFYACHCDKCKWTGSSEFVIGDFDGPFYCPYCLHKDPTDSESKLFKVDIPTYSVKEFFNYFVFRAFSLITQPIRFFYSKYKEYELKRWCDRSNLW